ncbi:hypothetical protein KNO15_17105 [Leifsonia shinshuensis]|uniref:hypothetical protein n=1 Tax=Leifsonia shinshuensis TaxID=150026 RepID=UPI001F50885C|nr:hypothetical protein [Leifsonia shinshuensis]MCI0158423.1 hypothetical protein [Leifsonia shinshuensis]
MDFSTFVPDVLSNLVSAAIASAAVAVLWPSRHQILAWLRAPFRVKDVGLYLSSDGGQWNIQVPKKSVPDVRWRLRDHHLTPTYETTSDDYTDAFRMRFAAYDQSYADDVLDIRADLERRRISMYVIGDVSGPPTTREVDEEFS